MLSDGNIIFTGLGDYYLNGTYYPQIFKQTGGRVTLYSNFYYANVYVDISGGYLSFSNGNPGTMVVSTVNMSGVGTTLTGRANVSDALYWGGTNTSIGVGIFL